MSVRYEHVNSVKGPDIYRWDECNFGGRSQESFLYHNLLIYGYFIGGG